MCVDLDLTDLSNWLEQFANFETQPDWEMLKLHSMEAMCEHFGHPERFCPCFHVAGSKGKGTIAADIAAILRSMGYKTGAYASPHLLHLVERVGSGAGPFEMKVYNSAFTELKTGVTELFATRKLQPENVTWYELLTMFAMLCFREAKVDFAIYEVGLGGRLDATNIVMPKCAIFGLIELEHTDFLGDTLVKVATEKAGIIKPKVPVISVEQAPEAQKVLGQKAEDMQTKVDFIPQQADYLADDAEVAMRAVQKVFPNIDEAQILDTVKKVQLPGRFELIAGTNLPVFLANHSMQQNNFGLNLQNYPQIPYLLIDVAHTPNSIKSVLKRMKQLGITGKLLFGCAADKNVEVMANLVQESEMFTEIYLTKPGDSKKSNLERMAQAFSTNHCQITANADYKNFIPEVLRLANQQSSPLIVLGSFYLAREVYKILLSDL